MYTYKYIEKKVINDSNIGDGQLNGIREICYYLAPVG